MKRKKIIGFVVLLFMIVSITIGYSFLSASLNINGTSIINVTNWDVHFNNIQVTNGSVTATTAPTIDTSKLNISYEVNLLNPGDFYEFTVDVVNGGSVDAKMTSLPALTGVSSAQDVYTNYTFTHTDGTPITNLANENLNAGVTKTYKVRIEFDRNISASQLPTAIQTMNLNVALAYEQA